MPGRKLSIQKGFLHLSNCTNWKMPGNKHSCTMWQTAINGFGVWLFYFSQSFGCLLNASYVKAGHKFLNKIKNWNFRFRHAKNQKAHYKNQKNKLKLPGSSFRNPSKQAMLAYGNGICKPTRFINHLNLKNKLVIQTMKFK